MKKITKTAVSLLCVFTMAVVAGCGGKPQADGGNTNMTEEKQYKGEGKTVNLMEKVEAKKADTVSVSEEYKQSQRDFAAELLITQYEAGKNTLISPFSAMTALTMTANGSKEQTRSEMEKVLGGGMKLEDIDLNLTSYTDGLETGEGYKLHTADSIWFTDNENVLKVNPEFLKLNASYFDAEIYKTPFNDQTLKEVNAWVDKHTDGMIPTILKNLERSEVMLLINALAFDAEWAEIYKESDVYDGEFTNASGSRESTRMMRSNETVFLSDENTTGFLKYYKAGYAFAALLPGENIGIDDYVKSLTGEKIGALLDGKEYVAVEAVMPSFKTECSYLMNAGLAAMGMPTAFTGNADFSFMDAEGKKELSIGRVIQKTFIAVDEKGTKAGAATVVSMRKNAAIFMPEKEVVLDRPFVYMIIDTEHMLPLFLGVENSVAAEK